MKTRPGLFTFLFSVAVATAMAGNPANAQTADHGKIMTVSRSVMVFVQLEQSLDDAFRNKDEAGLAKLLAANFELRQASNPGLPVPREDWLKGATPNPQSQLSQMAVHDQGTLAIASFLRSTPSDQPDQPAKLTFVVDVWKKQGDDWQLDTRYESDAGASSATEQDVVPNGKG
jgi:hypothetical protein